MKRKRVGIRVPRRNWTIFDDCTFVSKAVLRGNGGIGALEKARKAKDSLVRRRQAPKMKKIRAAGIEPATL